MSEHVCHGAAEFFGGPLDGDRMHVQLTELYLFVYAHESDGETVALYAVYRLVPAPLPPARYEFHSIVGPDFLEGREVTTDNDWHRLDEGESPEVSD